MKAGRLIALWSFVTVLAVLPGGIDAAVIAMLAFPLWYSSIEKRSQRRALAGTVGSLAGIIVAGLRDLEPALLLVASVGLVLGWATTTQLLGLREQLDDSADIDRSVMGHTGTTLAATAAIGVVVYGVFLVGPTVTPLTLVLVFVGSAFVLVGLDWFGR